MIVFYLWEMVGAKKKEIKFKIKNANPKKIKTKNENKKTDF